MQGNVSFKIDSITIDSCATSSTRIVIERDYIALVHKYRFKRHASSSSRAKFEY